MEYLKDIQRPSKDEQIVSMASYDALAAVLGELRSENPEIEIGETSEKIKIPLFALKLLAKILKATSQGKPVSIIPVATEMTTQAAAEILGCSRPHLVKLLEEGEVPYTKVGRHRRVKYEDVLGYRQKMKVQQAKHLKDMMKSDEPKSSKMLWDR